MADFKAVTVQDVHTDNLEASWTALTQAVNDSEFIALDLELSGLGLRKKLNSFSIEDRYKHLTSVVQSRAVIAVGVACFRRLNPAQDDVGQRWIAQTFDVSTLCSEEYTVEPGSVKFLVDHGFDFNRQYAKGLPYRRGRDKEDEAPKSVRSLISEIFSCGRPIIMHNALVDLAFLYGSFYADLPTSFDRFIADLTVIFSGGLYDTKCLAGYHLRLQASYLPYIFRYSQRRNFKDSVAGRPHISLLFLSPILTANIDTIKCKLRSSFTNFNEAQDTGKRPKVCRLFATHGFCTEASACELSHDLDEILDAEDAATVSAKRRKRRSKLSGAAKAGEGASAEAGKELSDGELVTSSEDDGTDVSDSEPAPKKPCGASPRSNGEATSNVSTSAQAPLATTPPPASAAAPAAATAAPGTAAAAASASTSKPIRKWCTGSHRAGFDAFMTGFFFAWCLRQNSPYAGSVGGEQESLCAQIAQHCNKVSLGGKPQPLHLVKSHFAKTSVQHGLKWNKLMQRRHSAARLEN